MGIDIAHLREWIGKTEVATDQITPQPMAALAATLDIAASQPSTGTVVPPLWHWLYFLDPHKLSDLAPDGHAKLGSFLPPIPLPRRMWAGGRFEFAHPLRVGETYTRTSAIQDIQHKVGRSGELVFVVIRHEIGDEHGVALSEEQDLVYREEAKPGESSRPAGTAAAGAEWERVVQPSDVLLFRYSALTFNAHRIHYDRRFAMEAEGYPGLVVHGPLIATLLLDLLRRNMPAAKVARFEFRAVSPLFDTAAFTLRGRSEDSGKTVSLWAAGPGNALAMTASALIG
jgi:3-methylfumaryl-CoA hydratase